MKRALGILLTAALISTVFMFACAKSSDPLVGTWGMVSEPSKTIKITKEGSQYFYEGSQGKTAAQKKDENTLLVPMGPIVVTVKRDPGTGILSVSFMGESYQYKKIK
ncbi:MAG: hypothetical protein ACYDFU_02060 [Nitrospirota bacterium]